MNQRKLIYGAGLNDADYSVKWRDYSSGKVKHICCPFYSVWKDMLRRCYSEIYKENHPTYKDVTCCEEWLTFSNFKAWMEQQDWEGRHLDKDLKEGGNRVYSPETCIFVSHKVNVFMVIPLQKKRKKEKIGVTATSTGRYIGWGRTEEGKTLNLGTFDTEDQAYTAWKNHKKYLISVMEREGEDPDVIDLLYARYN